MKNTVMIVVLFVTGIITLHAQKTTPDSPLYEMKITSEKKEYSLGEPIILKVEYINGSDKTWKLYRPDSSFYVGVSYRNLLWRTPELYKGYAFNRSESLMTIPIVQNVDSQWLFWEIIFN